MSVLAALMAALEKIGNLGPAREDGFLRAGWSDEESAAMGLVKAAGEAEGLLASFDAVGNLCLRTPGGRRELVQAGSHLDTVPRGGNYDGAAGVAAGLEAILALKPRWASLKRGLELVAWRGEESACYGPACKGSQAAFGLLDPAALGRTFRGASLEAAIRGQGFDPEPIRERRPVWPAERLAGLAAHLELHIEQAGRLEREAKDIGLVTGIRGAVRTRFEVRGEANHSGGTPMGAKWRRDANLAMAYMQTSLDERCRRALEDGLDLVQTVGLVNSDPEFNRARPELAENAATKISPYGYFVLDLRSDNRRFLGEYAAEAAALVLATADRFGVRVAAEELSRIDPVERLDAGILERSAAACRELGYSARRMPSGALHDAAVVAGRRRPDGSAVPVGMLFIPCREGLSHNPLEYASPEALAKGAAALARVMESLAS